MNGYGPDGDQRPYGGRRARPEGPREPDPLTDPWPSAPAASGGGERPRRGRRRKPETDPDLVGGAVAPPPREPAADSGPLPVDPGPQRPRGRRRRREPEEERDPLGLGAEPPDDGEAPFDRPLPQRTLDFDAVPVTRKGGRRRAHPQAGPVSDPGPEPSGETAEPAAGDGPDDDRPEADPRGRRARGKGRRAAPRRARSKGGGRGGKGKAVVVGAALAVVVAGGGFAARTFLFPADYEGAGSGQVEVVVPEGASGSRIGGILEDAGVVASSRAFTNALDEAGAELTPGTYLMRSRMGAGEAVELMLDPASRSEVKVTVPEGKRASEVLAQVSEESGIPLEDLQAAYDDPASLGLPDYAEQGPEGYLFPATYTLSPDMDAQEVLSRMVRRFTQVAEDPGVDLEGRAEEVGMDPNEVMAVAAIVQAETGSVEDMPDISAVVHNRLEEGMELGMDSTCFYVIGEHGIALTGDQLAECKAAGSDYATYGRKGLPAGPFVSPGEDAIKAALSPSDEDYLYFVATDPENGVTEFAETHDEFLVLKERFQQSRRGGA
ncbi:endolytic transglycosylase MltG [Nocardiopsis baichengensis]|uniref:endolytic transglycosylase MltG n=1 Tax=Nocardiopsis baichengensis TaxID=280240 RepID=UPI00034C15D4|nr:endolytic transglycosylase MltG [Nocardiopsis baichengensis]